MYTVHIYSGIYEIFRGEVKYFLNISVINCQPTYKGVYFFKEIFKFQNRFRMAFLVSVELKGLEIS